MKWVVLAVAVATVAIAVFHSGGAALAFLKAILGPVAKFFGIKLNSSLVIVNLAGQPALAASISVSIGAAGKIAAGLYAVGAVASSYTRNDTKRKKLSGKQLKNYVRVVSDALKLLKDPNSACYKFLKDSGYDPDTIVRKLRQNTPYDIVTSTNSASDINSLFDQYTIQGLFNGSSAVYSNARAATSSSGKNVYYRGSGIRISTMIHESIHQTTGVTDPVLAKNIGVSDDLYKKDEFSIDDALEKGGCK